MTYMDFKQTEEFKNSKRRVYTLNGFNKPTSLIEKVFDQNGFIKDAKVINVISYPSGFTAIDLVVFDMINKN